MDYDTFFENYMTPEKEEDHSCAISDTDLYTEEYWGKIPEFVKVSNLFDAMIEKARSDPKKMNPNTWKENDEICKIFASVFGLKNVWFYWIPLDERNAFTVTVYSFLMLGDSRDLIENRSGKGFYDKSHRSVFTIYGYCGLLLSETNITGKELTAIFLHELGHNFDYSPYHHIGFFTKLLIKSNGSTIEQNNNYKMNVYDQLKDSYDQLYDNQKKRDAAKKSYEKALKKYLNSGLFKNLINIVYNGISLACSLPGALLSQYVIRGQKMGEQFADSFATAYGYGPELITGLQKISRYDHVPIKNNGKVITLLRDLNTAMVEIFLNFGECHGTTQERTIECIKKLRSDLAAGDYPKGMKDDIEAEIKRLETIYMEWITTSPEDKLKITKAWRRVCDKFFGGAFNLVKHWKPNKV